MSIKPIAKNMNLVTSTKADKSIPTSVPTSQNLGNGGGSNAFRYVDGVNFHQPRVQNAQLILGEIEKPPLIENTGKPIVPGEGELPPLPPGAQEYYNQFKDLNDEQIHDKVQKLYDEEPKSKVDFLTKINNIKSATDRLNFERSQKLSQAGIA
jgi:hypothetical protein